MNNFVKKYEVLSIAYNNASDKKCCFFFQWPLLPYFYDMTRDIHLLRKEQPSAYAQLVDLQLLMVKDVSVPQLYC